MARRGFPAFPLACKSNCCDVDEYVSHFYIVLSSSTAYKMHDPNDKT